MPYFLGLLLALKTQSLGNSTGGQVASWIQFLKPIRNALGPVTRNFGIDISPFILIILLQILARMLW